MIKQIKKIVVLSCIALLVISLCGCGKSADKVLAETYSLEQVEKLEIKTNANDVIFRTTENSVLTITFKGPNDELASLDNGLLVIDLHKTFAGITIKELEPLYIDIPKDEFLTASIVSDAGNISITQVKIRDLSVNTEIGDITITGLTGSINAVSGVGSIETDLPYATEILAGKDGLGNTLTTDFDSEEKEPSNTVLYTNTGRIILK